MERYEREDGRWYCMNLERCLYGPAVVVWSGGIGRARVRVEPMESAEEGEKRMAELATRRLKHGYQPTPRP